MRVKANNAVRERVCEGERERSFPIALVKRFDN